MQESTLIVQVIEWFITNNIECALTFLNFQLFFLVIGCNCYTMRKINLVNNKRNSNNQHNHIESNFSSK